MSEGVVDPPGVANGTQHVMALGATGPSGRAPGSPPPSANDGTPFWTQPLTTLLERLGCGGEGLIGVGAAAAPANDSGCQYPRSGGTRFSSGSPRT